MDNWNNDGQQRENWAEQDVKEGDDLQHACTGPLLPFIDTSEKRPLAEDKARKTGRDKLMRKARPVRSIVNSSAFCAWLIVNNVQIDTPVSACCCSSEACRWGNHHLVKSGQEGRRALTIITFGARGILSFLPAVPVVPCLFSARAPALPRLPRSCPSFFLLSFASLAPSLFLLSEGSTVGAAEKHRPGPALSNPLSVLPLMSVQEDHEKGKSAGAFSRAPCTFPIVSDKR